MFHDRSVPSFLQGTKTVSKVTWRKNFNSFRVSFDIQETFKERTLIKLYSVLENASHILTTHWWNKRAYSVHVWLHKNAIKRDKTCFVQSCQPSHFPIHWLAKYRIEEDSSNTFTAVDISKGMVFFYWVSVLKDVLTHLVDGHSKVCNYKIDTSGVHFIFK